MRAFRLLLSAVVFFGTAFGAAATVAQDFGVVQSEVLVIDPERLFEQTQLGQSILADIQAARDALITRNRRIEAELEAEEQSLTEQRDSTTPEAFRELADAFDSKVQDIRRDSERRVRELERQRERAPLDFMRRIEPALVDIMRAAGGSIVIDARNVILRADAVDVTDMAIARIDALSGGPRVVPEQRETSPENAPDAPVE